MSIKWAPDIEGCLSEIVKMTLEKDVKQALDSCKVTALESMRIWPNITIRLGMIQFISAGMSHVESLQRLWARVKYPYGIFVSFWN